MFVILVLMTHESNKELCFLNLLLHTRLEVRDHYLNTIVKEVYDNIAQALSLVRLQLTEEYNSSAGNEITRKAREQISITIQDLRRVCKMLYPEKFLNNGPCFDRALGLLVKDGCPQASFESGASDDLPVHIQNETGILAFGLLQKMLNLIPPDEKQAVQSVKVQSGRDTLTIIIACTAQPAWKGPSPEQMKSSELVGFEQVLMAGGDLLVTRAGNVKEIKLLIPINQS
jgi:signal transduction histidine kinase